MATIFDFVADELERRTDLETLEARGTLRLALKEAGLDARAVTAQQMGVVLEKVMPAELKARGVAEPAALCAELATSLKSWKSGDGSGSGAPSPEEVFRRLADS